MDSMRTRDSRERWPRRLRELRPELTPQQVQALMQGRPQAAPVSVPPNAADRARVAAQSPRVPTIQPGDSGRHGWALWLLAAFAAALAWAWLGHA